MADKILLPNGCSMSRPSVNPRNWKTGGRELLKKSWQVQFYFYDPEFRDKYPRGKLIAVRGMNEFKTLKDRRDVTEAIIQNEIDICLDGFNHFTKTVINDEEIDYEIEPYTPFVKALWKASELMTVADITLKNVENTIRHVEKSAKKLRLTNRPISEIKRRNVKACLDLVEKEAKEPSNYRYNKNRTHLHMLFKVLVEYETIDINVVRDISKRVVEEKQREIITLEKFKEVMYFLKAEKYPFYRYAMVFFFAGIRSSELLSVQAKHVDLANREYRVLIKKGKLYKWETKAIILPAIPFWTEIMNLCKSKDDYLFSNRFLPGLNQAKNQKSTQYWRKHVKKKLGVTADFYTLKHLFLDLVDAQNDSEFDAAKGIASHKSSGITDVYRTGKKKRELEQLKQIDINL